MDPFFSLHTQTEISIRGFKGKSPMFFRDLGFSAAVFLGNRKAIIRALPDPRLTPIPVFRTKALVALHCMEYRDTDVGPYNEVSLSIPVTRSDEKTPRWPLSQWIRKSLFGNFSAYVCDLPVTTDVAVAGGVDFFGFPKYLAHIGYRSVSGRRIWTVRDPAHHDLVCEFDGKETRTFNKELDVLLNTYSVRNGKLLRAKMRMHLQEYGLNVLPGVSGIKIGKHDRSRIYDQLSPGIALATFHVPRAQGILFMPEEV